MPRADGPFKILAKINGNAYKLELPPEFGVSPTFNIAYLRPYMGEEDEFESRMNPLQEREDDEDITTTHINNNPPLSIEGPITRARARQLNLEVSSFLSTHSSNLDNRLLPYECLLISNKEAWVTNKGVQVEVEAQTKTTMGLFRSPGAA
jgi:hypothetical protein